MSTSSTLPHLPTYLLALEHLLGGQCRLTPIFTPSWYKRAVTEKGPGTAAALYPLIPVKDPVRHSSVIGVLMLLESGLLIWPKTRGTLLPLGLNTALTLMGVYSQRRMRIPYWLPCVNFVLGWVVWWIESGRGSRQ